MYANGEPKRENFNARKTFYYIMLSTIKQQRNAERVGVRLTLNSVSKVGN